MMSKSTIGQRLATKATVQHLLTQYDLSGWQYMVLWSVGESERHATTKWRWEALDVVAALRAAAFVGEICLVQRDSDTSELHKLDLETGARLEVEEDAGE